MKRTPSSFQLRNRIGLHKGTDDHHALLHVTWRRNVHLASFLPGDIWMYSQLVTFVSFVEHPQSVDVAMVILCAFAAGTFLVAAICAAAAVLIFGAFRSLRELIM